MNGDGEGGVAFGGGREGVTEGDGGYVNGGGVIGGGGGAVARGGGKEEVWLLVENLRCLPRGLLKFLSFWHQVAQ